MEGGVGMSGLKERFWGQSGTSHQKTPVMQRNFASLPRQSSGTPGPKLVGQGSQSFSSRVSAVRLAGKLFLALEIERLRFAAVIPAFVIRRAPLIPLSFDSIDQLQLETGTGTGTRGTRGEAAFIRSQSN